MRYPPPLRDPFVEQYADVLQNIEGVIVRFYREKPELTDHQVQKVLEGLERTYKAQSSGRNLPALRFTPLEQELADQLKVICAWRLQPSSESQPAELAPSQLPPAITVDELVACLKRVIRSVKLWNDSYGIHGYLNYIREFFL